MNAIEAIYTIFDIATLSAFHFALHFITYLAFCRLLAYMLNEFFNN
jgi:hypothetical protein